MRLWSIHPKYLDTVGLVALWREALLAQKVLRGESRGYTHHPQLIRFRKVENSIGNYLQWIYIEAQSRGYNFDQNKIKNCNNSDISIPIEKGQLEYEFSHLMAKLKIRSPEKVVEKPLIITPHSLFYEIDGGICDWEVVRF